MRRREPIKPLGCGTAIGQAGAWRAGYEANSIRYFASGLEKIQYHGNQLGTPLSHDPLVQIHYRHLASHRLWFAQNSRYLAACLSNIPGRET